MVIGRSSGPSVVNSANPECKHLIDVDALHACAEFVRRRNRERGMVRRSIGGGLRLAARDGLLHTRVVEMEYFRSVMVSCTCYSNRSWTPKAVLTSGLKKLNGEGEDARGKVWVIPLSHIPMTQHLH